MDGGLDFDLLAEYLLEDVGAGGFDFSGPGAISGHGGASPTLDLKAQPATVEPATVEADPGVVTPNGGSSFVEDAHAIPQLAPAFQAEAAVAPFPANGDLAGELSQVQQMIAAQQQHLQQQATATPVAPLPHHQPQPPQQLPQQVQTPPTQQQHPVAAAPNNAPMAVRYQPPPQQPKPGAAPVAAATATTMAGRAAPVGAQAQPSFNKRPRVGPPPPAAPAAGGYSFASTNKSGGGNAGGAPHLAVTAAVPVQHPTPGPGMQHAVRAATAAASSLDGGGRQKSQAQVDRRRERNRILARRTRLRKKFFFESLQKDVADLQRENAALKSIVRSRLKPDDARVVLERCDANERLPSAVHAEISGGGIGGFGGFGGGAEGGESSAEPGVRKLDREDFSLIRSIQNSQQCFVITDPSLHDNPIVYASDDFLTLTGYSQEEVLGRNCRFLQGSETCQEKVASIRKAVAAGEDVSVTFVNYRSDGESFWNSLFIAALRDADNNIVNFIGVIVKVAGPESGDSEYGKVLK